MTKLIYVINDDGSREHISAQDMTTEQLVQAFRINSMIAGDDFAVRQEIDEDGSASEEMKAEILRRCSANVAVSNAIKRRETLRCQLRDALSELAELEGLLRDMQLEIENLLTDSVQAIVNTELSGEDLDSPVNKSAS